MSYADVVGQIVSDDSEPVRKAHPVLLARRMTVREAARAAVAEGAAQLVSNLNGLADELDAELVHQARVALRRLRVYLRLFRAVIGRKRTRRLTVELRWLFLLLGGLRDLQVFEQTYLPRVAASDRASEALHRQVQRRSRLRADKLREAQRGTRIDQLRHALSSLTAELAAPGKGRRRVRGWLARKLDRQHERALTLAKAGRARAPEDLHELRKRLKKLRYAVELAEGLYPHRSKRVRRYVRRLRNLQDVLGGFMDQQSARQLLTELTPSAAQPSPLAKQLDEEATAPLAELSVRLPDFARAKPFWH